MILYNPVIGDVIICVLHYVTAIQSSDVSGQVTIRLSIDDFLYVLNRNQTRISLSFYDVITDIITPGSKSVWTL